MNVNLSTFAKTLPAHAAVCPSSEGLDIFIGSKHLAYSINEHGDLVPQDQKSAQLLEVANAQ
tara:strand:- start:1608 stop:1793 length:186 start_codon:yes stop_codon:yes gene_type:complete